jgi:hypothetical protein
MARLYEQLVQWRGKIATAREDHDAYLIHEVLSKYQIHGIHMLPQPSTGRHVLCRITLRKEDVHALRNDLESLGYIAEMYNDPFHDIHPDTHGSIIVTIRPSPLRLARVDHAMVSHPVRNLRYRSSSLRYPLLDDGYDVSREIHVPSLSHVDHHAYDHRLYMDIRAIDPTIDMNLLYDVYIHKHARESAVKDMYERWYPYLGTISALSTDGRILSIAYRDDVDTDALEPVLEGEYYRNSKIYNGPEMESMYDRIQTMLRMYYSYNIPYTEHMGTIYYES